ncbi:MAG: hypothetical protein D3919_01475 [Candidatus Electrothrix sp. AW5]|nr:hypothetical protein [Candidatus Electrothrix gigas]
MPATIFYSWQSDSENKINRNFIEDALKKAIKQLKRNEDVLSAMRDDSSIELDKDTQGVSGSPPIVDTILKKISQAAVFVPDLTFVGQSSSGRHLPNPNVLIEYGWALKALGHGRIVPVMNTVAGEPTAETMPFDMRHLRNPITYCLSETDDLEQRQKVKAELAKDLERALAAVFKQIPVEGETANVFAGQPITFIPSAFWQQGETFTSGEQQLSIPDVPRMFLRLIPKQPLTSIPTSKQVLDLIKFSTFNPMSSDWMIDGCRYERNIYGAFSFSTDDCSEIIIFCSQLFKTGEIWGFDCHTLDPKVVAQHFPDLGFSFIPYFFEDIFTESLTNYFKFIENKLKLPPPFKLIAGITDVQGFRMSFPSSMCFDSTDRYKGNVVEEHLVQEMVIEDCDTPPRSILMPFFEYVWEECGLDRPDKESLG